MFKRFRNLARVNPFKPTTAIFPGIDAERIAADLRLEAEGERRGAMDQPDSSEVGFDLIERRIVDCVKELRRMGLGHFDEHEGAYADRIARADSISTDMQTATRDAETDFMMEINRWRGILANERNDLQLVDEEFKHFRQENRLKRTAHEGGGFSKWLFYSLGILIVESVLNGVFFANAHELGLIGGVFTALGISVINVGVAACMAWTSRNFNHFRIVRKLVGTLSFLAAVAFAPVFNLFVAHFRNAAEAEKPWSEAAGHAYRNILANPLGLESIDAWLLGMLGILAATISGWKTYASGDPYPGYGRVWRKIHDAREAYAQRNEEAIDTVTETRDKAVDDLKSAIDHMKAQIADARNAANGLTSLRGQLEQFLEQCDQKVSLLLTTYRNANKGKRAAAPPAHFSRDFLFEPYKAGLSPDAQNTLNQKTAGKLEENIAQAIDRIYDACQKAIESFKPIDAIESGAPAFPDLQPVTVTNEGEEAPSRAGA